MVVIGIEISCFFFFLWLGSAVVGGVFGVDIIGDWLDFSWVFWV